MIHAGESVFPCVRVAVPEDHDQPVGRTISLRVVVLPAQGADRVSDPLFIITGGPGQAATDLVAFYTRPRTGALAVRDLVFIDQRGTGGSNPLTCPAPRTVAEYFGEVLPSDSILDACVRQLSVRADLRLYTTTQAARDLEVVRRSLGYDRINLTGASYGTRLVLEYVRRHPDHVRTAQLTGVVPPDFQAPLMYAPYAQRALDRLFEDCAADPECRRAHPSVASQWKLLLARLHAEPADVRVPGPDGETATGSFSARDLAYTVRTMLYGPQALEIPARVHDAAQSGDVSFFARLFIDRATRIWTMVAPGLHLSVFCAEDVPFIDSVEVGQATLGTDLGSYLVQEYRRACAHWPRGQVPVDFRDPVVSAVPILIVSGRRDPSTAPSSGDAVLAYMTHGLHVVHPWGGHGFPGTADPGCDQQLRDRFLASGTTQGLDTRCVTEAKPLPFVVEGPGRGIPPRTRDP